MKKKSVSKGASNSTVNFKKVVQKKDNMSANVGNHMGMKPSAMKNVRTTGGRRG